MEEEKRSVPRTPLKARGLIRLANGQTLELRTTDICASGLGAVCEVALALGSEVALDVQFYHSGAVRSLYARCRITHSVYGGGGFKFGLHFIELPLESMAAVRAVMVAA